MGELTMRYYPFPETKAARAGLRVLMLALLLLARDSMFTASILGFYRAQFLMLGLMALVGAAFCIHNRRTWRQWLGDSRLLLGAVLSAAVVLPMLFKRDWQAMYGSILVCIWFSVLLSYFLTLDQAAKAYVTVLAVLGAYSVLAVYGLRRLADSGALTVPVFENGVGYSFYQFGLSCVSIGFVSNRNFGIFREPGVYQFFLLLGLYLNQYRVRWDRAWKKRTVGAVLAVTLATTLATGGVVSLAVFGAVLFFEKKLYRRKWLVALLLVLAAACGVLWAVSVEAQNMLYWEIYDMLVGKFTNGQDSVVERTGAIAWDLELFLRSPLVGMPFAQVLHGTANNTTSTLVQLAALGLTGVWPHILGWLLLGWDKKRKWWVNAAMTGMLFLSFNTQNLTTDLFFWLFPTLALAEWAVPRLDIRRGRGTGAHI